ncbi:MAG: flagellar motor protein [Firmicutes bacterium]|nr:flagellar motor protein [Bacillota bacterium]
MDLITPIGFVLAVAAVIVSDMMDGGTLRSLINPAAILLVLGGTIGATSMSSRLADLRALPRLAMRAFRPPKIDRVAVVREIVGYADVARREGLLKLDSLLADVKDDFLRHGLMMAVDGTDENLVRQVLEAEMETRETASLAGARFFETAGGFAPTLGIIGTVIGLVSVLSNISDAAKLAPSIATAFIATLWGVSSANLFWLPIANKLKVLAGLETGAREIMLEGVLAIEAGDSPRVVLDKLRAHLTPEEMKALEKAAPGEGAAAAAPAQPAREAAP